ncbi:phosphoribosyl-ATP diphosphatase [Aureimonas fodinaquatilis]|uniref:Phosphoribosyl-ATP pyrophosphatase n=1 Tax=Aureimonas fodinaquatilis TaxID=2565783 RepID=A0A5B0DR32_9HYPH|nr:phosphoribosyl-ATP diphosphatase [Aureimonas fodinaquatilis]KAA0968452.1 phosphoribosyl-ATP diphosphatase [Aureimonas fodinaquatilis]
MADFSLRQLEAIIAERANSGETGSYTALLKQKGLPKVSQKLGEEAVETIIAALSEGDEALTGEVCDLLYHLLVLLHLRGIPLATVEAELQRRTAVTGLQEKASRGA